MQLLQATLKSKGRYTRCRFSTKGGYPRNLQCDQRYTSISWCSSLAVQHQELICLLSVCWASAISSVEYQRNESSTRRCWGGSDCWRPEEWPLVAAPVWQRRREWPWGSGCQRCRINCSGGWRRGIWQKGVGKGHLDCADVLLGRLLLLLFLLIFLVRFGIYSSSRAAACLLTCFDILRAFS